jgi:hypothetical protein
MSFELVYNITIIVPKFETHLESNFIKKNLERVLNKLCPFIVEVMIH